MTWPFEDRRTERSKDTQRALELQLQSCKEKGKLEAIVLADQAGLPISHHGSFDVCRELAAIAPYYAQSIFGMPLSPILRGGLIQVHEVTIDGDKLFLASISEAEPQYIGLLETSSTGIKRILSTH